ncbi:serine hydrolase [Jannaschia marina]|uniref:serine hydrolase n=1 Tax=Jannaschia marina TaxID=2741674 RepID=UPI0015C8E4E2|nr:serine hydrolase [Jannaschia marina]
MTVFDSNLLSQAPRTALESFAQATDAPATLLQVWRDGLSVRASDGVSDIGTRAAAGPDQPFEVGSQTKMMTAVVVLQLVAEGRVDLDTPLGDYVDGAILEGIPNADGATVRQLLANRSGVPDFFEITGSTGQPEVVERLLMDPDTPIGTDDLLDLLRGRPADFEAGTEYAYSNTNFILLEKLVEAVTGNTLSREMSDRIFVPAGMENTKLDNADRDDGRLSSYTDLGTGDLIDVTEAPLDVAGSGGVVSTTTDMIRFLDALLVSKTLLPEDLLAQMTDFRAPDGTPDGNGFGLGLAGNVIDGQTFIGFQGGTLGTNTATLLHVESGTIVSVAVTRSDIDPSELVRDAFDMILGDDAWARFDAESERFSVTGTAAEIELSEGVGADGDTETTFDLDGARLTFEDGIAKLDGDRFEFADGSVLATGDARADRIDILRDNAEAARSDNQLLGLGGRDHLAGGHGDDRILGGTGRDLLDGRSGDDSLDGGAGRDLLYGRCGDDRLEGGAGRDLLRGGDGADTLVGGSGRDNLFGGNGADVFVFSKGDGKDLIVDFDAREDRLDLSGTGLGFEDLTLRWSGDTYLEVEYGTGELIVLGELGALDEATFLF